MQVDNLGPDVGDNPGQRDHAGTIKQAVTALRRNMSNRNGGVSKPLEHRTVNWRSQAHHLDPVAGVGHLHSLKRHQPLCAAGGQTVD